MFINSTNIDWPGLTSTYNPVIGCERSCHFCYARRLHEMRRKAFKQGKKLPLQYEVPFNKVQFIPERLNIPKRSRVHKKIFVGSMSDICYWEPEWIEMVLDVVRARPSMEFMFLSKDVSIYAGYDFPENCWLGLTVTGRKGEMRNNLIGSLYSLKNKTFLSLEPLLGIFEGHSFTNIDLVIVGAMTGPGAVPPKREWIDSIKHHNIHYKANIKKYL